MLIHCRLWRMNGAGNTFFFLESFKNKDHEKVYELGSQIPLSPVEREKIVKKMCQTFINFKTDGFVFIEPSLDYDFKWDFYNSDGSSAEMCGNAARCAILFFSETNKKGKTERRSKILFETLSGVLEGEQLLDQTVKIQMPIQSSLHVEKRTIGNEKGFFLNTGVPHFVIKKAADKSLAKQLRFSSEFGLAGANITFISETVEGRLSAVTYERGVEDFTLSCGTGAVAAALVSMNELNLAQMCVEMPGGLLEVRKEEEKVYLIGPCLKEFDLEWEGELE